MPTDTEPDIWIDADAEGIVVAASEEATRMLGYPQGGLNGIPIRRLAPPARVSDTDELWESYRAAGAQSGTFEMVRADHSRLVVRYRATVDPDTGRQRSRLRPVGRVLRAREPGDTCPFGRPFPLGFEDCEAYVPHAMQVTDTHGRLLEPAWTCRHLTFGGQAGGRFYPRCRLGDPIRRARLRSPAPVDLPALRDLRRECAVACADAIAGLFAAPSDALAGAVERYLAAVTAWAGPEAGRFAGAGLELDAFEACARESMADFVIARDAGEWSAPAEVVRRHGPGCVAFFRPDLVLEDAASAPLRAPKNGVDR